MFKLISKHLVSKKIHYFILLSLYFLLSCNRDNRGGVDICHFDKKTDTWQTITVNKDKIQKHLDHGDPVGGGCEEYTYVLDTVFEQFLFDLNYDDVIDNHILISNIDSITHLNIEGRPNQTINSLHGIEAFKNLQVLYCKENDLVAIDLSKNFNLRELYCYDNKITKLDLSNNTNLEVLFCGSNKLSSLDVSRNINLKDLHCYNNQLNSLDLSKNANLERLYIQVNNFTNLDVSKNLKLTELHSNHNPQLKNLDLSNNINLEVLYCHNSGLINLDVSKNIKLHTFHCNDNALESLNVKNGSNSFLKGAEFRAFNNPLLTCIQVDNSAWSSGNWAYKDPTAGFSLNCKN